MQKLSMNFLRSSHCRKDNLSLDIKQAYAGRKNTRSFFSSKHSESVKIKMKKQIAWDKSLEVLESRHRDNRRFSLRKTPKVSQSSYPIQDPLVSEKIGKASRLMVEGKCSEAIPILRQLISKEENHHSKNKLYAMYADCLTDTGRLREAEQLYTKILNEDQNSYEILIKRGKARYELTAEDIGKRDLLAAIGLHNDRAQAYLQLYNCQNTRQRHKEALKVLLSGIEKNIQNTDIYLKAMEGIFNYPNSLTNPIETMQIINGKLKSMLKLDFRQSDKNRGKSQILTADGLLCEFTDQVNQACIFYEESVKFNSCRVACTIAVERLIINKIMIRDYYSSYHVVSRLKILNVSEQLIRPYSLFLEGAITIMKKKYDEGITMLENMLPDPANHIKKTKSLQSCRKLTHKRMRELIIPLIYKFLAYAYFKLGNHKDSIRYYGKLAPFGYDDCSGYNLLLAEGIIEVESSNEFEAGLSKFQKAELIYPNRLEPSIYAAMTIIYQQIDVQRKSGQILPKSLYWAVSHAIKQLDEAQKRVEAPSSNLLFHRCILNLYLQEFGDALDDINLCIEKAEENEPKSFYMRGICYSIVRDLKKAINQFSISLSLSKQYDNSLLERAKCYFLIGDTESGFEDLKSYMHFKPHDFKLHKWIGDLLYEGNCYHDAYKAYIEIDEQCFFEAELMKAKCLIRTNTFQSVSEILNKIQKHELCESNKIQVDLIALSLMKNLCSRCQKVELIKHMKLLNRKLQENQVGYIFELIDCMNLLGVAALYVSNYQQSYQSFLLVLELFSSLEEKSNKELKSDASQQHLSLNLHDIYVNIVISLLGMEDWSGAVRVLRKSLESKSLHKSTAKTITAIVWRLENSRQESSTFVVTCQGPKNEHTKLRDINLRYGSIKLICRPTFSLFHKCADQLYTNTVVEEMVLDLKPSSIQNLPEGPWIVRNEHGVVFTENMIDDEIGSSLISSMRESKPQNQQSTPYSQQSNTDQMRQDLRKQMAFDPETEMKLNMIIKNSCLKK